MSKIETNIKRLESLDALRGFIMLWIIGGEWVIRNLAKATNLNFFNQLSIQMNHKVWEGFHFYDLIMPLFLFMVGMSIPFSIRKRLSNGESKKHIYYHALRRSVILFILGMICQGNLLEFNIDTIFLIQDTLQAIAIGYFFSIIIFSLVNVKWQVLITSTIVITYWAIIQFVPVPGHEAGIVTAEINIAKYIDHIVLGRFENVDANYTWVLSSLGFISTVMFGVFASTIISSKKIKLKIVRSSNLLLHRLALLVIIGFCLVFVGQILNIWYPIIKNLWSASFILHAAGLSFLLMSLFYYIIDIRGYRRWAFWLKVIGMNSIAVYMASYLIPFQKIGHILIYGLEQWTGNYYDVINSIVSLVIVYAIMYWMYKNKTFIKI